MIESSDTDQFLQIPLSGETIDLYYHRTSIAVALKNVLRELDGDLLDIGCGKMPYKKFILENSKVDKYVGLDIESALTYDENVSPDLLWDGITIPIDANSYNCAMATEVLEHCPEPEKTLIEIYRILKPNGVFFFTVPFIWNLHEIPHDYYRYTPYALSHLLSKTGFRNIEISALGGWHGSMAQMLGLWMKRSSIRFSWKFKLLSPVFILMYKKLIQLSRTEKVNLERNTMISGLYGCAKKN